MEENKNGCLVVRRKAGHSFLIESPCGKFKVEVGIIECRRNDATIFISADKSIKIKHKASRLDDKEIADSFKK